MKFATVTLRRIWVVPFLFYRWVPGNRLCFLFKFWAWAVVVDTPTETMTDYFGNRAMAEKYFAKYQEKSNS